LWTIGFDLGNPEEDDWTSDLILGLDFIEERLCPTGDQCVFRVAPAFAP
jgi:hypothetical protein